MKAMLDGTRVLEFGEFASAPACTRLLAEMGAEVIKIEFAPGGDGAREMPYLKNGRSGYYVQQNRGKKSLCIDPLDPRAKKALVQLVKSSDVLVENLAVGEMARLGLGWNQAHALNPKLVMCSISSFGQTGPLAKLPGGNEVASAYSGAASVTGTADGMPVLASAALGDIGGGLSAAGSISFALLHTARTGKGQHLDIALIDVFYEAQSLSGQILSLGGGRYMPKACGSHHYIGAPLGFFRGKKMAIIIMVVDRMWPEFCQTLGREDLIDQPRFSGMAERSEYKEELVEITENWIQAQDSDEDALRQLQDAHITCAPVLTVAEATAQPHLIERGIVQTVSDRALGEFTIPGTSYRFSDFPRPDLEAPFLGEHNAQVLTELAGLTPDQIREMTADGALVEEAIPD